MARVENRNEDDDEISIRRMLNQPLEYEVSSFKNHEYVLNSLVSVTLKNTVVVISNCQEHFDNFIRNKSFPYGFDSEALIDMLAQVAKGLQFLHDNKIIHRDINPSHILLLYTSQKKIVAKLRISKFSRHDLEANQNDIQSNDHYKAFQCHQTNGYSRTWDKTTDIFSLGILSYYCLTEKCHPFAPDSEQKNFEEATKNIQPSKNISPNFAKLRKLENFYGKVQMITIVGMIRKMIRRVPRERLTIEEMLYHPSFYNAKKKLDFLLTIHEYLNAPSKLDLIRKRYRSQIGSTTFNEQAIRNVIGEIHFYDWRLMYDQKNQIPTELEDNGKLKFKLKSCEIFKKCQYLTINEVDGFPNSKWRGVNEIEDVPNLLKALRNKVAHACDPFPDVPQTFIDDFREGIDIFEYKPEKFLEVFLSCSPALLVHLHDFFRSKPNVAQKFYPPA